MNAKGLLERLNIPPTSSWKLTFKKSIATAIYDHDVPNDLMINLDQSPFSYLSPWK